MFAFVRRAETSPLWLALVIAACGDAKPLGRAATAPNGNICATGALLASHERRERSSLDLAAPISSAHPEAAPCPPLGPREDAADANEPCPKDMKLVDGDYCPNIQRNCVEEEWSPQNKITICHRFSTQQRCIGRQEHRRFCIDEYEYPNQKGGHPTWMVSWYDAQATCASLGKRLCYESEWVTA